MKSLLGAILVAQVLLGTAVVANAAISGEGTVLVVNADIVTMDPKRYLYRSAPRYYPSSPLMARKPGGVFSQGYPSKAIL